MSPEAARHRPAVAAAAAVLLAAAGLLARPGRFVVDGLSMAPGLLPGDVIATGWLPAADRLREPRRYERWIVTAPAGGRAVKRVAGLPGEEASIIGGDLVVDGRVALKDPGTLAEVAVPAGVVVEADDRRATLPPTEVLDDVAFAGEVSRPLETVRDVGIAAGVRVGTGAVEARLAIGAVTIAWSLPAESRCRIVGGRLDGHLVAVAWRDREPPSSHRRQPLPGRMPVAWSVALPWPADGGSNSFPIRLDVGASGRVTEAVAWRDIHLRAGADGTAAWRLGSDRFLLLGDFPTGSIDSRTFGPLPRRALGVRVAGRR